ncbi:MurR/RpiR family transcriptional regulator [Streptobacillus felis]|uniref:MurR/RpiR family transcriptional regulator n=1 Tax=Streptobacillus felis TaxID=1384509 RepID=A0A7Z0PGI9_9FUSO|nr:MurR/RpiR family transcriptional regulator [Streptobacillus felis]NYV28351.1 MurR/RpiR family transcriptional regulator [Streptobacillus felis]
MKYITLIESFYPSFSKQEIKVANFVIKERDAICFMPLHEITKRINVSEATIVRFVKKIGFKGFIDFKLEVAREISKIQDEHTKEDYIENIEYNILDTIKNTKALINKDDVEEAIKVIEEAQKFYVFGMGASGVAALEFQNRFMRFGKIGHSVSDGHFQVMYASTTTEKDVIVVISLSGETIDLIYPLTIAKERGCKIIAITNYIVSPIAKMSDIVILSSGKETLLDGGTLVSKISQLYIIDVLATGYALRNSKKAKLIRQSMAEAIANKNK